MKLSVVTTMYHSAPYLREFYDRIVASVNKVTDDYEIIFVNDGSLDNSLEIVLDFYEKDDKVKVIDLSRNFGHHKAMMTGLRYAKGDYIFLIDCDLEEDPEHMSTFYSEIQSSQGHVDVVYGVQERREGGLLRRLSGMLFYKLFNLLSKEKIPVNLSMTRLMTRRYVKNLLKHRERSVVLAGLFVLTGFVQKPISIRKTYKGSSTYSLVGRFSMFIDTISSFSSVPLTVIWWLGLIITIAAVFFAGVLIYGKIMHNINLAGWTGIMVSIWFLGGVTIFSIGTAGLYISKIFIETKKRPSSIVRKIYRHG